MTLSVWSLLLKASSIALTMDSGVEFSVGTEHARRKREEGEVDGRGGGGPEGGDSGEEGFGEPFPMGESLREGRKVFRYRFFR
jgi:hypothetical protein